MEIYMHDEYEISMENEEISTRKREGEKERPHKTKKRGKEVMQERRERATLIYFFPRYHFNPC